MTDNKNLSNDQAQNKLRNAAADNQGDNKAHVQDQAAKQNPKDLEGDVQRGEANRPVKSSTGK